MAQDVLDHGGPVMSVDGTDCEIREPRPFENVWYSHKSNGPAVRYEVGVSFVSSDIVWIRGPYPAGSHDERSIARLPGGLYESLLAGEWVVGDKGYRAAMDPVISPDMDPNGLYARARARHEACNARIKKWKVLDSPFRTPHDLGFHESCFWAVCTMVQIEFNGGRALFSAF